MYLCVFQVNNKSYYDELLDKVSNYVSPMQFDLFKLMLSVRTYSPAIEMSRQVRSALVVFFLLLLRSLRHLNSVLSSSFEVGPGRLVLQQMSHICLHPRPDELQTGRRGNAARECRFRVSWAAGC